MVQLDLNALYQLDEEMVQQLRDYLHSCHEDWIHDGNTDVHLVYGTEVLLQCLGQPGYEFS